MTDLVDMDKLGKEYERLMKQKVKTAAEMSKVRYAIKYSSSKKQQAKDEQQLKDLQLYYKTVIDSINYIIDKARVAK